MAAIRVEDVTVIFEHAPLLGRREQPSPGEEMALGGRVRALDHCHLTVAHGETVAVVGPSGCGKSTLLRVVAGLVAPQSGRVLYDGQDMADVPPKDRGIGMVFQNYALYPHWHGYDNLGFFFRLRKREREVPERVRVTSEIMGIGFDRLLARKPPTLSGGEQQRVAIGRCIVRDPRLFLLDEPLSNLDAKLRAQTRVEIKRLLRQFAVTTLYVTHDQTEAMALGDRLAVMRQGRVEQAGTYTELYERPGNAYVAGFLGTPPMNLLPAEVVAGRLRAEGIDLPLPPGARLAVGQRVLVGVRPEHLRYDPASDLRPVVELVEPLYAQRAQLVHFTLAAQRLAARLGDELRLQPGDRVPLAVAAEAVHVFDAQSGERL